MELQRAVRFKGAQNVPICQYAVPDLGAEAFNSMQHAPDNPLRAASFAIE